jgi:threonine/homoserine/homoserine lactone efflux protein
MDNTLLPLVIFAYSMCGTPGPNNIMLTASGASFGFKRTLRHIIGIQLGMVLLFSAGAFGVGAIFTLFPFMYMTLKVVGSVYLMYLAWRIMTAGRSKKIEQQGKPLTIIEAALFQFVNPKGLMITVTTFSTFTKPENYFGSVLVIMAVFLSAGICSSTLWAGFGRLLGGAFKDDKYYRAFNIFMGVMIVLSVGYILK